MDILSCGSLNIDYVYQVPHAVRSGETIFCHSFQVFAGGKGANQAVAMARAGAKVAHLGKVGKEGHWLIQKLSAEGVNVQCVGLAEEATGHAIIQVEPSGQNSIVVYPGSNQQILNKDIDEALELFKQASTLVLQNETSGVPYLMRKAKERQLKVFFNAAPFRDEILSYPLEYVDVLIVNEVEGQALTGKTSPHDILAGLSAQLPQAEIILTLGAAGAVYRSSSREVSTPAFPVKTVDTTGAGDTFVGYYVASQAKGLSVENSLKMASKAAAACVTRQGAMDSIPKIEEIGGLGE